jgi:ABC-type multidrug transport system ATPase subunit
VKTSGKVVMASLANASKRVRLQSLLPKPSTSDTAADLSWTLSRLGLWEARSLPVSQLSPSLLAAAEIAVASFQRAEVVILDQSLDRLDPLALTGAIEVMLRMTGSGGRFVFSSHRPDLLERCNTIIVLKSQSVLFAGSPQDLVRTAPTSVLKVQSLSQTGVRALVDPFSISFSTTEMGVEIAASEGQSIAAKLLVEGYGDVQSLILRQPSLEDAYLGLLRSV